MGRKRGPTAKRDRQVSDAAKLKYDNRQYQPPAWLSDEAKAEFRRVRDLLQELALIQRTDIPSLARYASFLVHWQRVDAALSDGVMTVPTFTQRGQPMGEKIRGEYDLAMKLSRELRGFEGELGLTPAARQKLHAEKQEAPTEVERKVDEGIPRPKLHEAG